MSTIRIFKKGQIVPRWLGLIRAEFKGAQHCLTFGIDAQWDGVTLKPCKPMGPRDFLVLTGSTVSRLMKNGTRRKSGFYLCPGVESCGFSDTTTGEYSASIKKIAEGQGSRS